MDIQLVLYIIIPFIGHEEDKIGWKVHKFTEERHFDRASVNLHHRHLAAQGEISGFRF